MGGGGDGVGGTVVVGTAVVVGTSVVVGAVVVVAVTGAAVVLVTSVVVIAAVVGTAVVGASVVVVGAPVVVGASVVVGAAVVVGASVVGIGTGVMVRVAVPPLFVGVRVRSFERDTLVVYVTGRRRLTYRIAVGSTMTSAALVITRLVTFPRVTAVSKPFIDPDWPAVPITCEMVADWMEYAQMT